MFVQLLKDFLGKKAGERLSVDDAEGLALVTGGTAVAVKDDPLNDLVGNELSGLLDRFTKSADAAITAALQKFADAQKLARKHAGPLLFGRQPLLDKLLKQLLDAQTSQPSKFLDFPEEGAL